MNVQFHTDGNEEETEQDVAERADVVFHLEAVFGFGKQHTGHKCAQCQRQAFQFGQIGDAERYQQHVNHEEFGRFAFGHQPEPRRHDFVADDEQHAQRNDHFQCGQTQFQPEVAAVAAGQCGNQNHQRHDRDVLH